MVNRLFRESKTPGANWTGAGDPEAETDCQAGVPVRPFAFVTSQMSLNIEKSQMNELHPPKMSNSFETGS
jgi:hypothetical protein